jgi:hypothetical protein
VADAVPCHFPQRVCEHRVPVAVAPVDRKMRAVLRQFFFERGD